MIFNDLIHRKLAAQLHPWLRDEPHLELKLGLFRSNGTLSNISFDTSKLNELLDNPSVYCFKEATVEHLSLQLSPFSSTAFTLVVRGIRVVLSLGEEQDEGGVRWKRKCRDTTVEDRNKALNAIDPEGCALHRSVKKISDMTTRSWGKSLLNTVLRHCRLQLLDIHLLLQPSCPNHPLSCSLYIKKFEIGSKIMGQRCFTRGFMSSIFVPSGENSFNVDIGSFEIRLNSEKCSTCVVPATNMFVLASMNHLHFTRFCFRIPTLNFLLSSADFSVLLIFYSLLSKDSKYTRTGRQLWNIVASRSKSLFTAPRMRLIKVVNTLCLSLRYIKTYQHMLLLVGYPTDKTMRRSTTLMLWDSKYSSSVKSQWKNINEIETDLPLESIILARRIIRSTMASTGPGEYKDPDKLVTYRLFSKLLQLTLLFLSTVINFFYSVMRILSLHKILGIFLGAGWSDGEVRDVFLLQQSISLNVQEINVSISPDVGVWSSAGRKVVSSAAVSQHNSLSLHLAIDGFFLLYTENMSEQRLKSASGSLKILSSIVEGGVTSYAKENQDKKMNGRFVNIWADPAQFTYLRKDTQRQSHAANETCSVPHLASHLGKLWLNWKDSCLESEGECTPSVHSPWILCDIRSFSTDHELYSRFLDCSLVVGKLNFNLDYAAVIPVAVLFRQIQYAIRCTQKKMTNISPQTPNITVKDDPVVDWRSTFRSSSRKIEMDIIRMFPAKHIQIGVLIEGPHVQVSLLNDDFDTDPSRHQLISQVAFEICNIELWVSPNLDDNLGLSHEHTTESKSGPKYLRLEEPLESDILKSESIDYSCQGEISLNAYLKLNGLKVYLAGPTANRKHQIGILSPMTAQLKYLRKDYHSFGSSVVGFSAVSHCVATGISILLYLDELYIFTKIIHYAFYESFVPDNDGSNTGLVYEEQSNWDAVYLESESGGVFKSSQESRDYRFIFSTTCEIKSFDVVLHNSRKINLEEHIKAISIDKETGRNLAICDACGNGIYISIQPSTAEFVSKGGIIDVVIDAAGVQLLIFESLTESEGSSDKSGLRNLLSSLNFLTEASVSRTKLWLHLNTTDSTSTLPSARLHNAADASSFYGKHILGESSSVVSDQRLEHQCLFMSVELARIYMAGCKIKDVLFNENNIEKLSLSFSAGTDIRSLSCNSKGGCVLLEASAAVLIAKCFRSYYIWVVGLWPAGQSSSKVEVTESNRDTTALISQHHANPQEAQLQVLPWDHIEIVSMSLSSLSLVLVATDESGRIQELVVEVDFNLNFKLIDTVREFSASSKLSLLSRFLYGAMEHRAMVVNKPSLSATSSTVFPQVSRVGNSSSAQIQKNLHRIPLNYILRDMKCSLAVEGPIKSKQTTPILSDSLWVGSGSVSGVDITLSLSEIKMILASVESVSELSTGDGMPKAQSNNWSFNEEAEEITEGMVTDGMIVAIQDVDQHMYIAVGGSETRYDIAGTLHYSLVGERSLFRVKFHNSRWISKTQYFSLVSLHARDGSGEPLRLSGNSQSRYVDISCPNDGASALWRIFPFKPDPYEDVVELESFHFLSKRGFHLVNKKNDCAVAFCDGVLEFVSQPGNLFKWKVFSDPGPPGNNMLLTKDSVGGTSIPSNRSGEHLPSPGIETDQPSDPDDTNIGELRTNADLSGIIITVQKVILTVVHELSDTEEKFPLLQGSLIYNQVIVQTSNSKFRFMNTFEVAMCYFDAHCNSWTDFMQPVEIYTFFSFKFRNQHPEKSLHGAPSNFYMKIKEVNILVSELALDILLFVIGEIDLAGPYAVKSSAVLANCCKVENQSGLTLLCQFYDNQDASVSPGKSTTIFLRHLALANRPPEASLFSIQLFQQGSLSTSPIHLSLLDSRQFAWRTRIVSSQDSKSFPGPLITIEISRRIEDGLSIVISPLLRIHNETHFSLELRFQRLNLKEKEYASLMLKAGSVIDDSMAAFSAINLSGGLRKVFTSLSVGNYVFSFRPTIPDDSQNLKISTVEWSDDLKGKKPVRLSGLFDKLSYQMRKAFSVDPVKVSLSSANCTLISEDGSVNNVHFLIQTTGKGIPVINPDNFGYAPENGISPVAMQEQKEVFVLPTVQVSNFLHTEIHVNLTDSDPCNTMDHINPWGNATIPYGSAVNFYVNPESIYFVVTLTLFGSSCRPVNSSDWVRKLQKKKNDIHHLDVELEFGGGKYFAMLRLSRGHRGTLKAVIFTSYALQNNTNTSLVCFAANKKPSPRSNTERPSSDISPDVGSCLPPSSTTSWFLKCHKLNFKLLEEKACETELDLDALSGFTEIDLTAEGTFGSKNITRLGVSLRPWVMNEVSSQIVSLSSRYVVSNECEEAVLVRLCDIEDLEEIITLNSKQRVSLKLKTITTNKKETNFVDKLLRKHTKSEEDLSLFVQFRPNEAGFGWSGPVCVASLGRFFLKFRKSLEFPERQLHQVPSKDKSDKFAAVHVVEEGSVIVLHFFSPPHVDLPYRIENLLHDGPITYYQKGSAEPETLGAGGSINYVWDDLTLPHKLVIQLDDVHLLREINLDKVRAWKPFYRNKQTRNLGLHLPLAKRPEDKKLTTYSRVTDLETVKVGYEIYAEGVTRVVRICEFSDRRKVTVITGSSRKMRLRMSYFALHLLEYAKQDLDLRVTSSYAPIIVTRFERLNWDCLFTDEHKYNQIRVQSLSVDEKWDGAPFSAVLRRHQTEKSEANDYIFHVAIVLLPKSSGVKPVKYLSIVLQPLDLNLDEETLMKIVPFWRKSLSQSSSRQQYYFDHFEIHPIKIVASFLPGDSLYSYSSTQETLRSLLHSVIKIPTIKNKTVELNGVLVTHALITLRELTLKCAQHYSWYSMRAIYIAKGIPLLPPAFASVFDDLASSSLDVFFDPSSGLLNLPGVTLGTLKLISKFIDNKGFSGTKRYFGDLGKTLKTAGSNVLFAAITEVSDSVLKGAETTGFNGMVNGFHQGILKLAMEPSVLSSAFMEGGPDRKIKLDRSPGVDELYIEGYLQAMLDTMYKQEYLRVRVVENQVILKNLPPSSSLIDEIMEHVKDFLASKALLKGRSSNAHSLRHIRGEREWRIGPTVLTLCEHLFVSFTIQALRKQAGKFLAGIKWKDERKADEERAIVPVTGGDRQKLKFIWRWGIGKFLLSGIVAYVDGRLCRNIPHPLARRIVSGFLLSFLDKSDDEARQ